MRPIVVFAVLLTAGCGGSDVDRAQLSRAERNTKQALRALEFGHGEPRHIRASCHKDDERSFHCDYGFDEEIGGKCLRYTATARGTITPRHRFRLDARVDEPINGSFDAC